MQVLERSLKEDSDEHQAFYLKLDELIGAVYRSEEEIVAYSQIECKNAS